MKIETFYDPATFTLTYVVFDEMTKDAVIIDPVLDYNPNSGKYGYQSADKLIGFIKAKELNAHYILETHAHADHITSSVYLKEKLGCKVAIGENIKVVQEVFKNFFNLKDVLTDGSQFDVLLKDGEEVSAGSIKIKIIATPGHTPACVTYQIKDMIFSGDALFMPDMGTGRCDFPKGSAEDLYVSVHGKLYSLPDETRIYVGHDYQPDGRDLQFMTTVGESKRKNIRLKGDTGKEEFVKERKERDAALDAPRLLLPSIQVNIQAGHLPKNEDNGVSYLKLPMRLQD